jgi:hypothetical protein
MSTFSSVACAEEIGSASEDYDGITGSITATVTLRCAWSLRHDLVADILGNRRQWPYLVTAISPIATKAGVRGDESAYVAVGQTMHPQDALVTISYTRPEFSEVGAFDIVSESLEPTGEYRTLDYRQFRWGSGTGKPITEREAPGKLEVSLKLVRRIFQVATPVTTLALTALGKCHDADYTSAMLGLTFPAESLLYLEPSFERTYKSDGTAAANYTQQWQVKMTNWNKIYRTETGTYERMYKAGAGTHTEFHETADLTALLG